MASSEWIIIVAMLLGGVAVYNFVLALLTNNTDKDVLSWASGNEPAKSKSPLINMTRPLVHQFTIQHAMRIKSPRYRKKLEKLILTAGLSRELNVDEFIGLQIFWGIAFPGFLCLMNFAAEAGINYWILILLAPIGWHIPNFYANKQKAIRETSARIDLPFFADLLSLSMASGLDFFTAISRIVDKAENSVLADELAIVLKDVKLGASRSDALRGLAKRLDIMEITSFVAVLVDADATGASTLQVLKDQSNQLRLERFVRAEKAGARASQLILFPIIFFIVPAVFIVVFGPVAVNMISGGFR